MNSRSLPKATPFAKRKVTLFNAMKEKQKATPGR
jgi:hypothetical protein